jgi:GTPase SAR1 family protein
MTTSLPLSRDENPFSSIFITPGAQGFMLPNELSWPQLHEKFCEAGRRGTILGEHGVGKTTLLATLIQKWRDFYPHPDAWTICRVQDLHSQSTMNLRQRVAPGGRLLTTLEPDQSISMESLFAQMKQGQIVIIDGFESWPKTVRWRFWRAIRRTQAGLVLTSHKRTPLPTLLHLKPQFEDFERLIDSWQPAVQSIERSVLFDVWKRNEGNPRECLFELYHRWES